MADYDIGGQTMFGNYVVQLMSLGKIEKFGTSTLLPQCYRIRVDPNTFNYKYNDLAIDFQNIGAVEVLGVTYTSKAYLLNGGNSFVVNDEDMYLGLILIADSEVDFSTISNTHVEFQYQLCKCNQNGDIISRLSYLGYSFLVTSAPTDGESNAINFLYFNYNKLGGIDSFSCNYALIYGDINNPTYMSLGLYRQGYVSDNSSYRLRGNPIYIVDYNDLGKTPSYSVPSSGEGEYDMSSDIIDLP